MRHRVKTVLASLLISVATLADATAQDMPETVILNADQVTVEQDGILIAEGDVEIIAEGRHLRAERVTYDRDNDRLSIQGPIILTEGPDTVILASAAELTTDLRDGVVTSIHLILDQRLQIAAAQGQRQQGRFTDLRDAVATSCEVCKPGQPPLWQIQASRVIHDEERERIYFQGARFHIYNVPIAYLPALSTPEPGVERAAGFLVPSVTNSDLFGTGFRTPYFIPLGDHADLTLTPYLAMDIDDGYTRTLEGRYRQAFATGNITFEGATSSDSEEPGDFRAYLFGEGNFDLPNQTKLRFGVELVQDDNYLSDYDFSSADRLENSLSLTRIVGDTRAEGEVIVFKSLRSDEDNDTIPVLVGDAQFDRRWTLSGNNGFVDAGLTLHGHRRPSDENEVGRDMAQARGELGWTVENTYGPGIRLGAQARAIADMKQIIQDDDYPEYQAAITPGFAVSASLPMVKPGSNGVSYLLEPVAQLVWSGDYDIDSPNDDSTQPAFDAGNLFGFDRFPGLDRVEDGFRANLALNWQRINPNGWTVGLTLGRVLRAEDQDLFSPGTGLDGIRSDWLIQLDLDMTNDLSLRSLTLVGDSAEVSLHESRLAYMSSTFDLSAGYVWQEEDLDLGQEGDLSEVTLDAAYKINDTWSSELELRRDLTTERTTRAEFGITYRNECVRVDLSSVRRFTNSDGAEPTMSYGIAVSFTGFGNGGSSGGQKRVGHCAG